jgi:ATP-dependent Zn protease
MSKDLLNILNQSNKDIDNQKIMDYLSNKLSAEEKHIFEEEMIDSELMNDAVEGLNEFKNKNDATLFVEELNRKLQIQLKKKNKRIEKRKLKDLSWLYVFIAIILLIIIISFFIINYVRSF